MVYKFKSFNLINLFYKYMKKINIIIIMFQLETFVGLENLYKYLLNIEKFNVIIINCKNQDKRWIHNNDAINYLNEKNYKYIRYEDGDLKYLKPNYVFYQTPYLSHFPKKININEVSKYSKICYFSYGYNFFDPKYAMFPIDYLKKVNYYFVENEEIKKIWTNYLKFKKININTIEDLQKKCFVTGCPKISNIKTEFNLKYRNIGWSPRWSPKMSNFENYYKYLTDLFINKSECNLISRFHPLDNNKNRKLFLNNINKIKNITNDENEKYDFYFDKIDIFISDMSTMIPEFFLTGKPIIYTYLNTHKINSFGKKLLEGVYIVKNKEELDKILNNLINNIDPLREKRLELIKQFYNYDSLENIANILN